MQFENTRMNGHILLLSWLVWLLLVLFSLLLLLVWLRNTGYPPMPPHPYGIMNHRCPRIFGVNINATRHRTRVSNAGFPLWFHAGSGSWCCLWHTSTRATRAERSRSSRQEQAGDEGEWIALLCQKASTRRNFYNSHDTIYWNVFVFEKNIITKRSLDAPAFRKTDPFSQPIVSGRISSSKLPRGLGLWLFSSPKVLGTFVPACYHMLGVFFRQAFVWFTWGWCCKHESLWLLGLGSKIGFQMDRIW